MAVRRVFLGGVVLLALASMGASCGQPIPKPGDAIEDPLELLGAVRSATEAIVDARFLDVRLDYFGDQGRVSVDQLILMQRPDRIRIQTYIPGLGEVAGVLVCACGQFAYHDRQQNIYYYGPATAQNVGRVMPVGLGCRDLAGVMLGGAPHERLGDFAEAPSLSWDGEEGLYRLSWAAQAVKGEEGDSRAELLVRHGDWRVAQMTTWTRDGEKRYIYTAKDFEKIGGAVLPMKRRFVVPQSDEDFSLTFGEVQLDPELAEELFELEAPGGSPVSYIGPESSPPPPPVGGNLCGQ